MPAQKRARSAVADADSDAAVLPAARFHFPSVRRGQALIDTYTYHSVDAEGKGKAREDGGETRDQVEGEWMLGVDEAGRGPALGEYG